jgi:hypothetical protein
MHSPLRQFQLSGIHVLFVETRMHPSDWILQRHNPSILLRKSKFRYTRGIEHGRRNRSVKAFVKSDGMRSVSCFGDTTTYENGIEFNYALPRRAIQRSSALLVLEGPRMSLDPGRALAQTTLVSS